MDRAARLLRGTLRVRVESAFPERVLNLCGAHGIAFSDLRWESASALSFTVRAAERKKLERLLAPLDAALTVERAAGAPFFLRRFRRRNHLFLTGRRIAHTDIIQDALLEQENILEHKADMVHQVILRHIAHIYAADGNAAGRYIPKPGNQIGNRTLAAAGRADNSCDLSLFC